MKELFPIASITKLTPRAAWIAKNKLVFVDGWNEYEDMCGVWCGSTEGNSEDGWGKCLDDAILDWAIINNIRLWNEEIK